jgi:hypothetical protein
MVKFKRGLFIIFRIVAFFTALIMIMNFLSLVFFPKDANGYSGEFYNITQSFRAEEPNTIDVFAIGNSDAYRAISPLTIWSDSGIPASVSGKGMQSTADAYKLLKDLYKKQNPKVVIIETDMVYSFWSDLRKHKKGKKKVDDVMAIVSTFFVNFEDAAVSGLGYYFPIIKNHSRWQQLTLNDVKNSRSSYRSEYKGFIADSTIVPYNGNFDYMQSSFNLSEELTNSERDNLDKMVNLCRKNGSIVILAEMPSEQSWNISKHNVIQKYADENNLTFIDFNIEGTLPTFDWTTDSNDGGDHMNIRGATKISKYLADYLKQNYSLPDRRGNNKYSSWDKCLAEYDIKDGKVSGT